MRDDGELLEARLHREGALPVAEVAPIVAELLAALEAMHARGVVHRAVSPSTVVFERAGSTERVRLIDPPSKPAAFDVTKGSDPSFSFFFLAPEQVRGQATVDARADVYAAGALAFYALTNCTPFARTNALTFIALKLDRPPPTLTSVTGHPWPRDLERFVATAMALDPRDRFPTAAAALGAWRELGVSAAGRA
jgi:serine/threonine-protein kinase